MDRCYFHCDNIPNHKHTQYNNGIYMSARSSSTHNVNPQSGVSGDSGSCSSSSSASNTSGQSFSGSLETTGPHTTENTACPHIPQRCAAGSVRRIGRCSIRARSSGYATTSGGLAVTVTTTSQPGHCP